MQKFGRIATEKRQTSHRIDHTIAFILHWKQTWQIFVTRNFSCKIETKNLVVCRDQTYFANFDSYITYNYSMKVILETVWPKYKFVLCSDAGRGWSRWFLSLNTWNRIRIKYEKWIKFVWRWVLVKRKKCR